MPSVRRLEFVGFVEPGTGGGRGRLSTLMPPGGAEKGYDEKIESGLDWIDAVVSGRPDGGWSSVVVLMLCGVMRGELMGADENVMG
jgi:hypothetical protein